MLAVRVFVCTSAVVLAGCSDSPTMTADPDAAVPGSDAALPDAPVSPRGLIERGRGMMSLAADVAADPSRDIVAVSGFFGDNLVLFDVSDPDAPVELVDLDIGYNGDVQFKGELLYVSHEMIGRGIDIFDTADPANPVLVGQVDIGAGTPALDACHNTWPHPERELLYCASTATGQLVVLSTGEGGVGSPIAPAFVASVSSPNGGIGVHDMYAAGDRLYVAFLDGGFAIYDNTDGAAPTLLRAHQYAGNFTHNLWPTTDHSYLLTTDEVLGGRLRVFDIRDLDNITQVASYGQNDDAVIHNVEIVGDTAYVSYYVEGMVVLDISDPTNPTRIDGFDMVDGPDIIDGDPFGGLRGAWGVEPVGDMIYVSETSSGLWIFELER